MKLITLSHSMQRVAELVDRVAAAGANVLVLGESGAGKDTIARLIHDKSGRRDRAYVKIDCASLPEDLLESELFGYEKGAFTGATEAKPGRFEAADGGTLVLDEIASLSPSSQAKLLRVIEERQFAARSSRVGMHLSQDALALLESYDFPGNVRELRNIIELAVLRADREVIEPEQLPDYLRSAARLMQSRTHKPSLAELEAVYIREVLEHTRGNKTRAAEILGISRKNLYEKMRRYNIGRMKANHAGTT